MPQAPPATGPAADAARAFRHAIDEDCARHGWTYQQLVSRTSYSQDHILTIIEGRQRPTRKVAAALDVVFGTGQRYYQLWERFHQARHQQEPRRAPTADRANTQRPRYPGETAAPQPPDAESSAGEDHANRRDAVMGLGALLLAGAVRSKQMLRDAETSNVGPLTLEELDESVVWLTEHSGTLPKSTLLEAADKSAGDVATYLAGHQSGKQRLHLEELAGQLTYFQGREIAAHFGDYGVALTHLRLARHYGGQLGHHMLLGSVADMESTIACYQGRFQKALEIARKGQRYATHHTAARLAIDEAKAYAGLGQPYRREMHRAIDRAERVLPNTLVFEPGAALPYGQEMYLYHGGTACVRAGDERGAELASEAIREYEALRARQDPRSDYANLASARLDLAISLAQGDRPEPKESARLAIRELAAPTEFQTNQLKQRVKELLVLLLAVPAWRDLPAVRELAATARSCPPPELPGPPSHPALSSS